VISLQIKPKGADDFLAALKKHPEKISRTTESIVKQEARGLAVSLGAATLPKGLNEGANKKLQTRIHDDIKRLFPSKDNASRVFEYLHREDERLAKAFWAAYKSGDEKAQARILRRAKIPKGIDPAAHQAARGKRGKVPVTADPVSFAPETRLNAYIRRTQKKAGLAKAGWAAAANALGGRVRTRSRATGKSIQRFPKFVRALQKRSNIGGGTFQGGPRAFAKIWNIVPYIGEALPENLYYHALDQAERDFVKALNRSVAYLNKNRFNRSRAA
jgi:hypothetical protein